MPKSFVQLLAEWRNRGLEEFRNYSFPPGNNSLAQAYKKRKYLFDTIYAGQGGEQGVLALEESARALDALRGACPWQPSTAKVMTMTTMSSGEKNVGDPILKSEFRSVKQ